MLFKYLKRVLRTTKSILPGLILGELNYFVALIVMSAGIVALAVLILKYLVGVGR